LALLLELRKNGKKNGEIKNLAMELVPSDTIGGNTRR